MKRIATLLLLSLSTALTSFGQTENDSATSTTRPVVFKERQVSVLTGLNFWRTLYGELGLAINEYGQVGTHPFSWAYFVSNEFKMHNKLLIGPKIGAWIGGGAGGAAMGLNLIYYTDFEEASLRVRPEIGMGFDRWKVVYGYNIPLTNKGFEGINKSTISVAYLFGVKKLNRIQEPPQ